MSYQLDIIEDMYQQLDDDVSIHIYLHKIDLTNQARSFFDLFADEIDQWHVSNYEHIVGLIC
jgi:hypothetical protein